MNRKQLVSATLLWSSIGWVVYTIISSFNTTCFDMLSSYITIFIMLSDIIWNNFIIKGE